MLARLVRFEGLQESHIYIKPSWMCPPLGWFQSCTHLELPLTAACQQGWGGGKRKGAEEGRWERCREAGRRSERGRQAEKHGECV